MSLLKYKHEKLETKEKIKNSKVIFKNEENFGDDFYDNNENDSAFDEGAFSVELLKNTFNSISKPINFVFENDLLSDLTIFEDFIKSHYPDLKNYIQEGSTGEKEVSLRALIDLKDYLLNEFGDTATDLLDPEYDFNGKNLNYSEFSIKNNGKIYKNNNIVFDPTEPCQAKVKEINFENFSVTLEPGLIIPFSYILKETREIDNVKIDSLLDSGSYIKDLDYKNNDFYKNLILDNKNITDKNVKKISFSGDITADELFKTVGVYDYSDDLKRFVLSPELHKDLDKIEGITVCNLKDINFIYLLMLLLIGGGEEGVRPATRSSSQTIRSALSGCSALEVNNFHPMLWTNTKKQGLKRSALQFIMPYIDLVKGFNIRPIKVPILGKVFDGICILGNLEKVVYNFQANISKKIREAFKCEIKYTSPKLTPNGYGLSLETETVSKFTENNPVKSFISRTNSKAETGVVKEGSVIDAIVEVMANKQYPLNYVEPENSSENIVSSDDIETKSEFAKETQIDQVPSFVAIFNYKISTPKTGSLVFEVEGVPGDLFFDSLKDGFAFSFGSFPVSGDDEIKSKKISLKVDNKKASLKYDKEITIDKEVAIDKKITIDEEITFNKKITDDKVVKTKKTLSKKTSKKIVSEKQKITETIDIEIEKGYFFIDEAIYLIKEKEVD